MTLLTVKRPSGLLRDLDSWEDLFDWGVDAQQSARIPSQVQADDDTVTVILEAPGMSKSDFEVTYEEGILTVSGEKVIASEDSMYSERSSGKFSRQFRVGDVDFDASKAQYTQGVLTIKCPKSPASQPQRLKIS